MRAHRYGRDKAVHLLFEIGVIGKGIDGVLELIGGFMLLALRPERIGSIVRILTQHELSEDPNDVVANFLTHSLHHLSSSTKLFGAVFLLWHGAIKIALVWALLRRRRWAYPAAMVAFAGFVAYQLYRYTHTHSVWLIGLSLLDVFVIMLTWLEYQRLKTLHEFRVRAERD